MAYALYRGTRLGLALQEALGEMEEYEQISPNVRSAVLRKFDEVNACLYFLLFSILCYSFDKVLRIIRNINSKTKSTTIFCFNSKLKVCS